MSDERIDPEFGEAFWEEVDRRAERVRDLARTELHMAEQQLSSAETEECADIVPVFTGTFWARVTKRACKVRRMALDELADAEDRLLRPGADRLRLGARWRVAAVAAARRLQPPSIPLSPRARVNTLGFVTAVLALLMLVPQVVPSSSLADVRSRGPLALLFGDETPDDPADTPDQDSEPSPASSSPGDDPPPAGSTSDPVVAAPPAERGSSEGVPEPAIPDSGEEGSAAEVSAATVDPDTGDATSEDGSSGGDGRASAPADPVTRPNAPSNLLATAVDDTSVRLRWRDNSPNEAAFVVERQGDPSDREVVDADTKRYVWGGLAPNTQECFRVRARNGGGQSPWTGYRCVATHDSRTTAAPVALSALACSREDTLSSGPDLQESEIVFRNQAGEAVNLHELGEDGVRDTSPRRLAPGATLTVATFVGDTWVVTDTSESANCLAIFTPQSWESSATILERSGPASTA